MVAFEGVVLIFFVLLVVVGGSVLCGILGLVLCALGHAYGRRGWQHWGTGLLILGGLPWFILCILALGPLINFLPIFFLTRTQAASR
jgi:hypothetical protein